MSLVQAPGPTDLKQSAAPFASTPFGAELKCTNCFKIIHEVDVRVRMLCCHNIIHLACFGPCKTPDCDESKLRLKETEKWSEFKDLESPEERDGVKLPKPIDQAFLNVIYDGDPLNYFLSRYQALDVRGQLEAANRLPQSLKFSHKSEIGTLIEKYVTTKLLDSDEVPAYTALKQALEA